MRIPQIRMPIFSEAKDYLPRLLTELDRAFRTLAEQINGVTEGRQSAFHASMTAAPTTGTWARGDFVRNSEPVEAGSSSSKYVVTGWICTVGGTPGTWLACRTLTGN